MPIPLPPAQVLPSQTPAQNWLSPNLVPYLHLDTDHTEKRSSCIVAIVSLVAGTYLLSRCLETALVYLLISRSLHSNCSACCNIFVVVTKDCCIAGCDSV
jgi:hypothetical protein